MLVDGMNRCFVEKLVETTADGGRDRGGEGDCGGQEVQEADLLAVIEGALVATL
ncbi:hypothetical protein [Sphingomonas rubra]|uniref:hypothetical protein n=1 Tax=Sphingomonas rubra TaxID=634430 RepID=UPI0015A7164D